MAIGVALVQVLSLEQEAFKVHVETSCRLQLGLVSDLDHLVLGCSGIKIGVPIIIVSCHAPSETNSSALFTQTHGTLSAHRHVLISLSHDRAISTLSISTGPLFLQTSPSLSGVPFLI